MTERKRINREVELTTILHVLPDLTDAQLAMVADYIRGVKAAEIFLNKGHDSTAYRTDV